MCIPKQSILEYMRFEEIASKVLYIEYTTKLVFHEKYLNLLKNVLLNYLHAILQAMNNEQCSLYSTPFLSIEITRE